jgi:hypothetical protein
MIKNKLLEIYKNFHLIRFSQQYLMEIYHPENKKRNKI